MNIRVEQKIHTMILGQRHELPYLFVLLAPEPSVGVSYTDAQLLGTLDQNFSALGGDSMGDFSTEFLVLHHKDLELLQIIE